MSTLFCFDFDETLSNTDRLKADIVEGVHQIGGEELVEAYKKSYEAVRAEHGTVRMPLVIEATAARNIEVHHKLADLFRTLPYEEYVYPDAKEVIMYLKNQGRVIIFSDGDAFFQPQKIYTTSLAVLVDGVIILPQKTEYFADLAAYLPAEKYVFIDDKQRVLDAAKAHFGERATTVHVRQGQYAQEDAPLTADISVMSIGEVRQHSYST